MKMKWFIFAWRNVTRNFRRSAFCVITVAVGTVALLLSMGFVGYTYSALREFTIANGLGHLRIATPEQFHQIEDSPLEFAMSKEQAQQIINATENLPQVNFAFPELTFQGIVSIGEKTTIAIAEGIDAEKEKRMGGLFTVMESGSSLYNLEEDPYKIMLAKGVSQYLGAKENDSVTLLTITPDGAFNAIDMTVAGVFSTGIPEKDNFSVKLPIKIAQELLLSEKVTQIVVSLHDTETTQLTKTTLHNSLQNVEVQDWYELSFVYKSVTNLYNIIFGVMGVIIVIVVLLSISNTMNMTIMERTRETGTLRAFGISRQRVIQNFCMEGVIIGALGSIIGVLVAKSISIFVILANIMMPPPPIMTIGYPLRFNIDLSFIIITTIIMIITSTAGAFIPASHVAKKKVVEALLHV